MTTQRRMVRVPVHVEIVADMIRGGGMYRYAADIPQDAEFEGAQADPVSNSLVLFFSHESFPLCDEGARPEIRFVATTHLETIA